MLLDRRLQSSPEHRGSGVRRARAKTVVKCVLDTSHISFDVSGLDFDQAKSVSRDLERIGIKRVWLNENCYPDTFVEVAALLNSTQKIQFGTIHSLGCLH